MDSCSKESQVHTVSELERCKSQYYSCNQQVIICYNSSEEEIIKKLKVAPFDFTVKLAAAIGKAWQQSA